MLKITGAQALDARKALKLTQGEVAKETGIARAYISQFENGIKQLTRTEVITLKDYFIDKGFVFDSVTDSKSQAVLGVEQEAETLQTELSQHEIENKPVVVDSVELGDLVDSIESLVSLVKNDNEPVELPLSDMELENFDPESFEEVKANHTSVNARIYKYFSLDHNGEVPDPRGLFTDYEARSRKVISLMAMQYLRMEAMRTGFTPFSILEGIESDHDGVNASEIKGYLQRYLSEETQIDSIINEKAA